MLPQTLEELDAIRDECKKMVLKRAGLSAGAAVVPVPGLDAGADAALLMELIPAINRKFGLSPEQIETLDPQTKKITLVAATSIGSELIGKTVTQQMIVTVLQKIGKKMLTKAATKFVPLLGQALAASVSFSAMKLVGDAHVEDCYKVARQALEARLAQAKKPRRTKTTTVDGASPRRRSRSQALDTKPE